VTGSGTLAAAPSSWRRSLRTAFTVQNFVSGVQL